MSLRDSYFNGPSGIQQQMDGAFAAGVAYVGAGVSDLSTLDLNDRNGSNLGAGSGNPGLYFKYSSPTVTYAMWLLVSGEVAPTISNATLVPVSILVGDSASQVAAKIAAAMNLISGTPFSVTSSADVLSLENNVAGGVVIPINVGTLGGTASVNQVDVGVNPTGNFSTLQQALVAAAAQGQLEFSVLIQGTGTANAMYLRSRNGHNLYLGSFFSGIMSAMSAQQIYDYQVELILDISTNSSTNVIFRFNFGNHRRHERVNTEPLSGFCNPQNTGFNGGPLPI